MSDSKKPEEQHLFHEEAGGLIFDKPRPAEEIRQHERENEAHEFQRAQVEANKSMVRYTRWLVVATFCTIAASLWQGSISQRAANAAKRAAQSSQQAADTAEKARIDSVRAAAIAATQAQQSLQASIDNFHAEERAWVVLSKIEPDGGSLKDGSFIAGRVTLANTGKTPALHVILEMAAIIYTKDHQPDLRIARPKHFIPHYSVIPPNDTPNSRTQRVKDTEGNEARMSEYDRLRLVSGETEFYVFGRVSYEDVSGAKHKTQFCAVLNSDLTTFHSCIQNFATAD